MEQLEGSLSMAHEAGIGGKLRRDATQLSHEELLLLLMITVMQGFKLTTVTVNFTISVLVFLLHDCLCHMDVVVVEILGVVGYPYKRGS